MVFAGRWSAATFSICFAKNAWRQSVNPQEDAFTNCLIGRWIVISCVEDVLHLSQWTWPHECNRLLCFVFVVVGFPCSYQLSCRFSLLPSIDPKKFNIFARIYALVFVILLPCAWNVQKSYPWKRYHEKHFEELNSCPLLKILHSPVKNRVDFSH